MEKNVIKDLMLKQMKHEVWKQFGFQNVDPRTDFRAAGLLAVTQLDYFARKYPRVSIQKPK